MKTSLFTRVGWFFLPCSVGGGILYLLAGGFCATVFVAVDRHSHSASDTFYGIYPFFVATFLLLDWVARRLSETPNQPPEPTLASGTPPAGQEPRHR
jgi:peptidoglycan/LPS O-acetylase OafA/YrhL